MSNFKPKDFQKQVLGELDFIRNEEHTPSSFSKEMEAISSGIRGCLWTLFFRALDKLSKKAADTYKEQKQTEKWEKEADRLLAVTVIRQALCSALQNVVKSEILNEERLVDTVIETLAGDAFRKTFAIHLEPVLFGFISYKLSKQGIEKYCNQ